MARRSVTDRLLSEILQELKTLNGNMVELEEEDEVGVQEPVEQPSTRAKKSTASSKKKS